MLASQKIVQLVEKLRCMRAKDGVPTAEANQQTCRPRPHTTHYSSIERSIHRNGATRLKPKNGNPMVQGGPEAILTNELQLGMKRDANDALKGPLYPQSLNLETSHARPVVGLTEKSLLMWA